MCDGMMVFGIKHKYCERLSTTLDSQLMVLSVPTQGAILEYYDIRKKEFGLRIADSEWLHCRK